MIILKDDREKPGWHFKRLTKVDRLLTGDYTVKGLEDVVCVDRKATANELHINLYWDRERFEAELERMRAFKYAFIVCEFPYSHIEDYPQRESAYVQKVCRVNGQFLKGLIDKASAKFGIPFLFFDGRDQAKDFVLQLFTKIEKEVYGEK